MHIKRMFYFSFSFLLMIMTVFGKEYSYHLSCPHFSFDVTINGKLKNVSLAGIIKRVDIAEMKNNVCEQSCSSSRRSSG